MPKAAQPVLRHLNNTAPAVFVDSLPIKALRGLSEAASARPRYQQLIADLELCDLSRFVQRESEIPDLAAKISTALTRAGLCEVGSHYHFFGPGAVTAAVCLAESHFNFHSWPEYGYVSLDLLCCSPKGAGGAGPEQISDNGTARLEQLLDYFSGELFFAGRIKRTIVFR